MFLPEFNTALNSISSFIQMLLKAFGLKTRLSTTTRSSAVSLTWPSARRGIMCATMRLRCSGGETSKSLVEMKVWWLCGQCCSVGDHNWNDYTEQKLKQFVRDNLINQLWGGIWSSTTALNWLSWQFFYFYYYWSRVLWIRSVLLWCLCTANIERSVAYSREVVVAAICSLWCALHLRTYNLGCQ